MARTSVPERLYAPGDYVVDLPAVPVSAARAAVRISRTASIVAASGTVATVRIGLSDDGLTWRQVRVTEIPGGAVIGRDGVTVAAESLIGLRWPGETVDGVRRALRPAHVRILVTVHQACRTAITLESE